MPKDMVIVPEKMPSQILQEIGLSQDGWYAVDGEGEECFWDSDTAIGICMLGAVFLSFELDSADFENRAESCDGFPDIANDMSSAARRYVKVLNEVIWEMVPDQGTVDFSPDDNDTVIVGRFSDGLEDERLAYDALVECEVRLEIRAGDGLNTLTTG